MTATAAAPTLLWNCDAEQAVLGAMLLDQDAARRAVELLDDTHFYQDEHRRLFRAARAIVGRGSVIDPITLQAELEARGELAEVGGAEYLAELVDAAPTAANLEHHAKILADLARRRRVCEAASQAVTDAREPGKSIEGTTERLVGAVRSAATPEPFTFVDDTGLANLPGVEWIVDGVLPAGGLSYLVGVRGTGKTLLGIDWACSIALGRDWCGRAVRQGAVDYVAAEGARSLHSRVGLWKGYRGLDDTTTPTNTGVRWYPRRLPLLDTRAVDAFITARSKQGPLDLLVIDTQARCTQGMRENDSDGTGQALESVDRIRETLNTSVLLVTHPPREGSDNPRGHSSQDGAADAIWVLKDHDSERVLTCSKLKDGDEGLTFSLRLVALGDSVLLLPADRVESQQSLTPGQRTVLATIRDLDHGPGVAASIVIDVSKLHKATVYRVLSALVLRNYVAEKSSRYRLTPTGLSEVSRVVARMVA